MERNHIFLSTRLVPLYGRWNFFEMRRNENLGENLKKISNQIAMEVMHIHRTMFPVRCYTCGAVLAHLYPLYRQRQLSDAESPTGPLLDELKVHRLCCRRMFLGFVDLVQDQLDHPNIDRDLDHGGTRLLRFASEPRTMPCD